MSKNLDKNLIKELELLGLHEKEAVVYIDLLKRPNPTGTSKIVISTGLHGQYIYTALESLEQKGLVKHSVINGRKKFEANSPERLSRLVNEKKVIADRLSDELLKISNKSFEQSFEIYQGESSFVNHEIEVANESPKDGFWYVISSRENQFAEIMGDSMKEFTRISKEKNIKIKVIGTEDDSEYFSDASKKFPNYKYKILPGLKKGGATSIVIRNNNVSFESFEPSPLCYTIHNQLVADSYKNVFEALWNLSKKLD